MKKYTGYFVASGICLIVAAFFAFALVGYRFLGLCFLALAALILVFAATKALGVKRPGAARGIKTVLWCFIAVAAVGLIATEAFIVSQASVKPADPEPQAAIVLGAGVHGSVPSRSLKARLEAALEYAEDNRDAVLVLSGGQGRGEDVTEAMCMYDWLVSHGVSGDRLILEERASSTKENLEFSKELLDGIGYTGGVCVITAGYHIARAKMMARDVGFTEVTARGRGTGMPVLELNYYLREAPGIWVYLMGR